MSAQIARTFLGVDGVLVAAENRGVKLSPRAALHSPAAAPASAATRTMASTVTINGAHRAGQLAPRDL